MNGEPTTCDTTRLPRVAAAVAEHYELGLELGRLTTAAGELELVACGTPS
ncbi:MAG: hypothetical protein H0V09_01955 [Gemmatimonadetes bacterium]|nr:hypothetical protein [Gemmatimonadota bacterium]